MSRAYSEPFKPTTKRNRVSLSDLDKKYKNQQLLKKELERKTILEEKKHNAKNLQEGPDKSNHRRIYRTYKIGEDPPPEVVKHRKRNIRFGKYWINIFAILFFLTSVKLMYFLYTTFMQERMENFKFPWS